MPVGVVDLKGSLHAKRAAGKDSLAYKLASAFDGLDARSFQVREIGPLWVQQQFGAVLDGRCSVWPSSNI